MNECDLGMLALHLHSLSRWFSRGDNRTRELHCRLERRLNHGQISCAGQGFIGRCRAGRLNITIKCKICRVDSKAHMQFCAREQHELQDDRLHV
eukprot:6184930-Pleurochrysis_carterae.AAC.7